MAIHPTAIVSPKAELGENVEIGPWCHIADGVVLGNNCRLMHHVSMEGPTKIGDNNTFHPFCSVGSQTQDLKYAGEPTYLEIGSHNTFREHFTANRGTAPGEKTIIGSHNNFLAYSHVAHNCIVGNHCVFSNNGTIGGHVIVEDYAVIGGLSATHQFCRIGTHSMVGGCSKIVQDVPPFFIADGNPATIRSVNLIGLQRRGFSDHTIRTLRQAFRIIYDSGLNTSQAVQELRNSCNGGMEVKRIIQFIESTQRGIIR